MVTSPPRADILAIVSGKGGVGKTTLAVNLGMVLSQAGKRVTLLDGDFGHATANGLLTAKASAPGGASAFPAVLPATGRHATHAEMRVVRVDPPIVAADAGRERIARVAGDCDYVLIDCASGFDDTTAKLAAAADRLLVVTTPEPAALAESYATLKLARRSGFSGAADVVVNFARRVRDAERTARRMARVAEQFLGLSPRCIGHISHDAHVPRAARQRVALVSRYPNCAASACIREISRRLAPMAPRSIRRAHLWRRVAALFL